MRSVSLSVLPIILLLPLIAFGQAAPSKFLAITPIDGPTLRAAIRGNSLIGSSGRGGFVQHFSTTGMTIYRQDNGTMEIGQWGVRHDGLLCTLWPVDKRLCYFGEHSPTGIRWYGPTGPDGEVTQSASDTEVRPGNLTGYTTELAAALVGETAALNGISDSLSFWLSTK